MKKEMSLKYFIISIIFIILYLAIMFVLIVESLTPSKKSAQKSKAVGRAAAGFINDIRGDQKKEVNATSCKFKALENEHVFSVGETYSLTIETYPLDSTHQSYEYFSSDTNKAKVSSSGVVTFIESGEVTIKAVNIVEKDVFCEINLKIDEVMAEKISSKIIGGKMENDYYVLEKNKYYKISNTFTPTNTTNKKVTYSISDTNIISISKDTIFVKEISSDFINVTITSSNGLKDSLKIKTIQKEAIEEDVILESISSTNITKYTDETTLFNPNVKYNPAYTSNKFKGYTLESLDDNLCEIVNNKIKIKGVAGTCPIKITSTYDSSISTTINVVINNRSNITNFDVNYSKVMYLNDLKKLSVKNVKPYGSKVNNVEYESSDSTILEVNNGIVKALSIGSTYITVTLTDTNNNTISKTIDISVVEKPLTIVDDFDIDYLDGETPVIFMNTDTDLTKYFNITKFYNNGVEVSPSDKNYYFSFDEDIVTMSGNTIKVSDLGYGLLNGYIYYKNSDTSIIYKPISLYVISDFSINNYNASYDLNVNGYLDFIINDEMDCQKYEFSINGTSIEYRLNNKNFRVTASDAGTSTLTITPIMDDLLLESKAIVLTFNSSDIYTKNLNIDFYDYNNKKITYNSDYTLYVGKSYSYKSIIDKTTTKSEVVLSDNQLIDMGINSFTPLEVGELSLTFVEKCSGIEKTYTFIVRNVIKIESSIYEISGSYKVLDGKIEITNGDSAKIDLSYSKDTTFKETKFESLDSSILKVYEDGTLEPQKQGDTTIKLSVNDGYEYKEYEINFSVHKKNVIDNISSFSKSIRKSIGHYGAFLVLAIFATISYALMFRGKIYFVGVGVNFITGFMFAAFTEYLQTLTPGRVGAMSDILIDYSGYLTSAIIITIIFTLVYGIRFIKNKRNNLKNVESSEVE